MKAVVQDEYGSPEVLELRAVETPAPGDGQVLVRVRAASVNPPDQAGLSGVPFIVRPAFGMRRPKNPIRGTDMAGVVEAVGEGVTQVAVGDEVFGMGAGTFAEHALAVEKDVAPKPANVSFEQAAGAPMAGLTALQALRDAGKVRAGQKVLIVGAGGGIGTFAVQIAKSLGAEVTGVCSTSKVDLVRSIGADHAIDYTREDFTQGAERYDVILDSVVAQPLSHLVRVLKREGTLIPNGGQFYKRWIGGVGVLLVKAPLLSLFVPQTITTIAAARRHEDFLTLAELMASGSVKTVVGRTFPLERTAEALAYFSEGHAEGKVVITV